MLLVEALSNLLDSNLSNALDITILSKSSFQTGYQSVGN
jgi:hypothetical protein